MKARRIRPAALLASATAVAGLSLGGVAAGSSGGNGAAVADFFPSNQSCAQSVSFSGNPFTGLVVLHGDAAQNDTRVHVTLLNGTPDSVYVVELNCALLFNAPSFRTNRQGNGGGEFDFPVAPAPGRDTLTVIGPADIRTAAFLISG
jgi:hypothetical protein